MTFNKVIIKVLEKDHPKIKRRFWGSKYLELGIPNSIKFTLKNKKGETIEENYGFSERDLKSKGWKVVR